MADELVEGGVAAVERAGNGLVNLGARRGSKPRIGDVANQHVVKPKAVLAAELGPSRVNESPANERHQLAADCVSRLARRRVLDGGSPERPAGDRRAFERGAFPGGKGVEPGRD